MSTCTTALSPSIWRPQSRFWHQLAGRAMARVVRGSTASFGEQRDAIPGFLQRLEFFYADPATIWVRFDDLDHGRHVLKDRLGVRTPIGSLCRKDASWTNSFWACTLAASGLSSPQPSMTAPPLETNKITDSAARAAACARRRRFMYLVSTTSKGAGHPEGRPPVWGVIAAPGRSRLSAQAKMLLIQAIR